eukprot:scaffold188533_cov32-Tisochrysis_lutea.AAC.1
MQGRAYSAMASDAVAVKLSRMAIVKEPNRADVTRPECSGPMEVHSTTPAEQTVAAPNGTTVGTASPSLVDRQDAEPVHASPPSHESKSPPIRNGRGETGDDSAGEWVGPLWHERRGCNVWVNSETGAVRLSPIWLPLAAGYMGPHRALAVLLVGIATTRRTPETTAARQQPPPPKS